ncbi:nuclear transport factor 2 family protein [Pedomonas sp. V897]|uniref:nuclear transport factor 2 family protein n=1 Tax=Pedomonas sp. V897 TaxID=3446482 RepID=UPI003EE17AAF
MKAVVLGLALTLAGPLLATPAALAAGSAPVRERVTPEVRQEIVAAIDAWRAAVVNGDRAGLERAYHEDLTYGHTDGGVENKEGQINRTIVPGRRFTAVDVSNLAVRVYGDVAYVTATYAFHILNEADGAQTVATLPGLDVWTRQDGRWQLIARQLTRFPK